MSCDDIQTALAAFHSCSETDEGSRVSTHCLYPSFEPVNVFVVRIGDGFRVHDGGGATRSAWIHGRDESLISRMLNKQALRYQISVVGDALVADAPNLEWLGSAILAVANASAAAAHAALDRFVTASEAALKDKMLSVLKKTVSPSTIVVGYEVAGRSKQHQFDFAVKEFDGSMLLLNAVSPHHVSISSKYVAFSDIVHREGIRTDRWAVHDRPLDAGDVSLLLQVADIVPLASFHRGLERLMLQ
jgi:hypothetical protein